MESDVIEADIGMCEEEDAIQGGGMRAIFRAINIMVVDARRPACHCKIDIAQCDVFHLGESIADDSRGVFQLKKTICKRNVPDRSRSLETGVQHEWNGYISSCDILEKDVGNCRPFSFVSV